MLRWLLAIGFILVSGCATVPPWDRGLLACESMDPEDPAAAMAADFENHTFDVREGSAACGSAGGGGCGCN